jgi:hypothetical protein
MDLAMFPAHDDLMIIKKASAEKSRNVPSIPVEMSQCRVRNRIVDKIVIGSARGAAHSRKQIAGPT